LLVESSPLLDVRPPPPDPDADGSLETLPTADDADIPAIALLLADVLEEEEEPEEPEPPELLPPPPPPPPRDDPSRPRPLRLPIICGAMIAAKRSAETVPAIRTVRFNSPVSTTTVGMDVTVGPPGPPGPPENG
jgi:hypothetical protein